ncbi:MAG TPA: DUF2515 family protein [Chondromyces sp.]|nr:DUF2515 family protein [Chondromyces sp.]
MNVKVNNSQNMAPASPYESAICQQIREETDRKNIDNISRTVAYHHFYREHPEVKWSFLAAMVSRNAGYNMCDLQSPLFHHLLKEEKRSELFMTYESANWLIFHDAFPQLLVYKLSRQNDRPMFHLLDLLSVSSFMRKEWERFWKEGNEWRLMQSLIINEQNIIQKPILNHPVYKKRVFRSGLFFFEDRLHFSSVVFPTIEGELYGVTSSNFRRLDARIKIGNRLAYILFAPRLYTQFLEYAQMTEHTGSRRDYEQYQKQQKIWTPALKIAFPVVEHKIDRTEDWSKQTRIKKNWFKKPSFKEDIHITDWYDRKRRQLMFLCSIRDFIYTKKARK